jgi:hypothetical protein
MQIMLECPCHLAHFGKVLLLQACLLVPLVSRCMREPILSKGYCSLKCWEWVRKLD